MSLSELQVVIAALVIAVIYIYILHIFNFDAKFRYKWLGKRTIHEKREKPTYITRTRMISFQNGRYSESGTCDECHVNNNDLYYKCLEEACSCRRLCKDCGDNKHNPEHAIQKT